MKLDFQVGTSKKAHKILQSLDSNKSKNPKAPFNGMNDAYLFALILGLSVGKKTKVTNATTYANFSSIERDYDIAILLTNLGEESDMESRDSARIAIQEYATWGLLKMDDHKIGDDYRFGDMLESLLG